MVEDPRIDAPFHRAESIARRALARACQRAPERHGQLLLSVLRLDDDSMLGSLRFAVGHGYERTSSTGIMRVVRARYLIAVGML